MVKKSFFVFALASCLVFSVEWSQFAFAQTIVFGSGVTPEIAGGSGDNFSDIGSGSGVTGDVRAQGFSPLSSFTIDRVKWTGMYHFLPGAPASDTFTIRIYDATLGPNFSWPNGDGPGNILFEANVGNGATRTDTGFDVLDSGGTMRDLYEYEYSGLNISLTPGTNYWFSVFAETNADGYQFGWSGYSEDNNPAMGPMVGSAQGDASNMFWTDQRGFSVTHDFTLLANVPAVILGDVNLDGAVSFADIPAFIAVLLSGEFQGEADCDQSGAVDFSDIPAFIAILLAS